MGAGDAAKVSSLKAFHARSIADREGFWAEQAALIEWERPFERVLDYSNPPFARWFVGGRTNLCHNAVDRHLASRGDAAGADPRVDRDRQRAHLQLRRTAPRGGADGGDPARARGASRRPGADLHADGARKRRSRCWPARASARSTRWCSAASLRTASRVASTTPARVLVVSADAGSRAGKVVAYKPLLDDAIDLARNKPASVLMVDRGLAPFERVAGRDHDYAALRERHLDDRGAGRAGSSPTKSATRCTPPAPPAPRRACSAMSAATRSRWRRR